ncbi:MAG: restriction endonuclease subunit S [Bacteroidales bacterium]|nr:restriction endonuclease subunit S [Bacteroidales bacterium]
MREGWEYKKLGEVCFIERGGSPRPIQQYLTDRADGLNWIKIGDAVEGSKYINSTKEKIKPEGLKKTRFIHKGDFILSNSMSFGKPYILGIDGCIHDGWLVIRDNNKIFDKSYLYYLLSSPNMYQEFKRLAVGGVVNNLNSNLVRNVVVPIPPLAEQERIVAELDLLSSIIEKKKAQLKEFDQLAQSIFYDMFGDPITNEKGWEVKKLGESVHEMFLGPFGSSLKVDSYVAKEESYCMVYEQKHAIQGTISLDNHYINKDKYESLKRFEVKPNDFIMSCRGTIGRLFQLPHNAPLGIIHPSLMKIRIKDEVYNAAYFQFMLVKIVANENTNGNCVQMAITAKQLSKKELTIPPLPLQKEFASKVEAIERQKTLIQQSIDEVQTLFDSRMDYWFD